MVGKAADVVGDTADKLLKTQSKITYDSADYQNLKTDRGTVSLKDLHAYLRPIAFGEISNDTASQEGEIRGILNTALNRIKENKNYQGKDLSLKDVLTEKNAYQAYQPTNMTSQYSLYRSGGNAVDTKKKQTVDNIVTKLVGELKDGTFQDNTDGAYYYQHKDGKIAYDTIRQLFKDKQKIQ